MTHSKQIAETMKEVRKYLSTCSMFRIEPNADKFYELLNPLIQTAERRGEARERERIENMDSLKTTRLDCGCEVIKATLCDRHAGFISLKSTPKSV